MEFNLQVTVERVDGEAEIKNRTVFEALVLWLEGQE